MFDANLIPEEFKGESRFGVRELVHLLVTILLIDYLRIESGLGFAQMSPSLGKQRPPSIDAESFVSLGDFFGFPKFQSIKGRIHGKVIIL